jgi:hypothetical protein
MVAGSLAVATMLLCIGAGYGLGVLVGAPAVLAIIGVFVGLGAGFAVVYARFKDI